MWGKSGERGVEDSLDGNAPLDVQPIIVFLLELGKLGVGIFHELDEHLSRLEVVLQDLDLSGTGVPWGSQLERYNSL